MRDQTFNQQDLLKFMSMEVPLELRLFNRKEIEKEIFAMYIKILKESIVIF